MRTLENRLSFFVSLKAKSGREKGHCLELVGLTAQMQIVREYGETNEQF
jgi:hypothetical protein